MSDQPKPLYRLCEEWRKLANELSRKVQQGIFGNNTLVTVSDLRERADELESWAKAWDEWFEQQGPDYIKGVQVVRLRDIKQILGLPKGTDDSASHILLDSEDTWGICSCGKALENEAQWETHYLREVGERPENEA